VVWSGFFNFLGVLVSTGAVAFGIVSLGNLLFPGNESGNHGATHEPFHHEGLKAQSRYDVLTLRGGLQASYVRQPLFDWELRATPTPYEGLQELAFEYKIGSLRDVVSVEVISFNVAAVDFTSAVSGSSVNLCVFLAHGLSTENLTLGYRISSAYIFPSMNRSTNRCPIGVSSSRTSPWSVTRTPPSCTRSRFKLRNSLTRLMSNEGSNCGSKSRNCGK
jgi:hypothetical protein